MVPILCYDVWFKFIQKRACPYIPYSNSDTQVSPLYYRNLDLPCLKNSIFASFLREYTTAIILAI